LVVTAEISSPDQGHCLGHRASSFPEESPSEARAGSHRAGPLIAPAPAKGHHLEAPDKRFIPEVQYLPQAEACRKWVVQGTNWGSERLFRFVPRPFWGVWSAARARTRADPDWPSGVARDASQENPSTCYRTGPIVPGDVRGGPVFELSRTTRAGGRPSTRHRSRAVSVDGRDSPIRRCGSEQRDDAASALRQVSSLGDRPWTWVPALRRTAYYHSKWPEPLLMAALTQSSSRCAHPLPHELLNDAVDLPPRLLARPNDVRRLAKVCASNRSKRVVS
jgi:hypothetical protein